MLLEAKCRICLIFQDVEKQLKLNQDEIGLEKINELRVKVNTAMLNNDTLQKWSLYKETKDYQEIVSEFSDALWSDYSDMALASAYFQKPCFFNED